MSEFGVKIKNYEAASIYEYYYGFRDNLDSEDAMLTNSLFKDFLIDNGLEIKHDATRDIICVAFSYKTKTADYVQKRLFELAERAQIDGNKNRIERIREMQNDFEHNKDKCYEISRNDLRIKFYEEGLTIPYRTYNKSGKVIGLESIHYKMLFRTPGKAKKGTCMFIRDEMFEIARQFLYMGIKLPDKHAPIVEIGAYSSLITSSIVGKVQILPNEILTLKDVDSFMTTKVIKIKTDQNRHCYTENDDAYQIKNTIFDGQALIDQSIFPEWANGYILLRHHFTKMAAFNTNIQQFMHDHYGDEYEHAQVEDMFGRKLWAKDIKLITTESAFKWCKFNISIDYWFDWISKNDYNFGIVKTTHESKLGDVQRMSYQMVNALDINSMNEVTKITTDYIEKLKSDIPTFLDYLSRNINFSNDFDVLIALVNHNPDFIKSEYFRERRRTIIKNYMNNIKEGHIIQNGDNLTLVGSPYAMLMQAVGDDPFDDPTFCVEDVAIQCYTERFQDDEYLAEFRSPFNSRNNLGYLHNKHYPLLQKYFNLGKLCIAVNTIGTNFEDKNNGSDFDSDSIYTTNIPSIVSHAKYCSMNYPTIVNQVPKSKNQYDNTLRAFAEIDNKLSAAQNAIGQSSNLAQIALSYTYNFDNTKYYEYVCILSVLAQIAIDNAKRSFDINLIDEIDRIKKDMDIDINGLPAFWEFTKKDKRKFRTDQQRNEARKRNRDKIHKAINKQLVCPMNYIANLEVNTFRSKESTIPTQEFLSLCSVDPNRRRICKKVEDMIQSYSLQVLDFHINEEDKDEDDYLLLREDFQDLIQTIRETYISTNYIDLMSWLLNRAFMVTEQTHGHMNSNLNKNKVILLKTLYTVSPKCFLQCFQSM